MTCEKQDEVLVSAHLERPARAPVALLAAQNRSRRDLEVSSSSSKAVQAAEARPRCDRAQAKEESDEEEGGEAAGGEEGGAGGGEGGGEGGEGGKERPLCRRLERLRPAGLGLPAAGYAKERRCEACKRR